MVRSVLCYPAIAEFSGNQTPLNFKKDIRMKYKTNVLNYLSNLRYMFLLTLAIAFLSTGCQLDSSNNNSEEAKSNLGKLEISFLSSRSRTLQPNVELVADSYRVVGTGPDGKSLELTVDGGNSIQLDSLEIGDWNFIVEAFTADSYLFSRGSVDVTVVAGVLAQETIILSILQNTGSFSLSIEVPESMSDAPLLIGTLQSDLQADIPLSFSSEAGSTGFSKHSVFLDNSVPAGYYTLSVTVYDDVNALNDPSRYTGFADSVRILDGLTTTGAFTLNDAPGNELTLNIEFVLNEVIDVTLLDAQTLPTSFDFNSVTQYWLTPSIPVDDNDAGAITYEWFMNGQLVSDYAFFEVNSMGRLATATTTRTLEAPTLTITDFIAGSPAEITSTMVSNSVIGNFASVANGGQNAAIVFDIEITDSYDVTSIINIQLDETALLNIGVADITNITIDELNFAIESQIMSSPFAHLLYVHAPSPLQLFDNTGFNGGSINFVPVSSNIFDLTNIGFTSDNRIGSGIADIAANNEFQLEIYGDSYNAFNVFIPIATYASVFDLAAAIQSDLDASGGAELIDVSSLNDRLVFTNKELGRNYYIYTSPSNFLPPDEGEAALAALKLDNLEEFLGTDENPSEPRYLPGQYTVDLIAKNQSGTRSGSTSYTFEVLAN